MPELLHVGSLIVDDVQDSSPVRRGGPAAHIVHGTPLAINAGSACYFLAEMPAADEQLSAVKRVAVYEAYFQAVRAAHAGQALDIDGLSELMPYVVETGDGALLEKRLRATHRLKSAVPPSALARMAAVIGDGTKAQVDGLGNLFEAFGVAFQIVDDVLNLKGFQSDLKVREEDISEGKVTAPVAKSDVATGSGSAADALAHALHDADSAGPARFGERAADRLRRARRLRKAGARPDRTRLGQGRSAGP